MSGGYYGRRDDGIIVGMFSFMAVLSLLGVWKAGELVWMAMRFIMSATGGKNAL